MSYTTTNNDIHQVSDGDGGIPVEAIQGRHSSQAEEVETSCAGTTCRRTTA